MGREEANRSNDSQELVTISVHMTPSEYESIRRNASWDGKSVANYLVDFALGKTKGGC